MTRLAHRILGLIDETGPREPGLLQRILRAGAADYERAIGQLVLKGMIVFRGRTNVRTIHRNGRRMI